MSCHESTVNAQLYRWFIMTDKARAKGTHKYMRYKRLNAKTGGSKSLSRTGWAGTGIPKGGTRRKGERVESARVSV
jgi:hypothetical protein